MPGSAPTSWPAKHAEEAHQRDSTASARRRTPSPDRRCTDMAQNPHGPAGSGTPSQVRNTRVKHERGAGGRRKREARTAAARPTREQRTAGIRNIETAKPASSIPATPRRERQRARSAACRSAVRPPRRPWRRAGRRRRGDRPDQPAECRRSAAGSPRAAQSRPTAAAGPTAIQNSPAAMNTRPSAISPSGRAAASIRGLAEQLAIELLLVGQELLEWLHRGWSPRRRCSRRCTS